MDFTQIKDLEIYKNEPLKNHSTFKIGGPAKYLIIPHSLEGLRTLLDHINKHNTPYITIGLGSNILFPDEGYDGIVIKISEKSHFISQIEIESQKKDNVFLIKTGSGVLKKTFCNFALEHSLEGAEFLAGIPGTIGGGLIMNAGTYMGKFADITKSIVYIDENLDLKEENITNPDTIFKYRAINIPKKSIILNAIFKLKKGDKIKIKNTIDQIINIRKDKHPLDYPNCGSIFKNPAQIPAGILIEKNNLKGFTIGEAQVSKKHANFIINLGNAKASDVKNLINHIKEIVQKNDNILLEEELIIL